MTVFLNHICNAKAKQVGYMMKIVRQELNFHV